MDSKKKWASPQALIVIAIVLLIFVYIGIDMAKTKPAIKADIKEVKENYIELSGFLDEKLPEIDSTLEIQAQQIAKQGGDIGILNYRLQNMSGGEEELPVPEPLK